MSGWSHRCEQHHHRLYELTTGSQQPLLTYAFCACQALYGRLDRVFVPDMYEELTTQRVLIMEWVNGRRLRSGSDGAQRLADFTVLPGQHGRSIHQAETRRSTQQNQGTHHIHLMSNDHVMSNSGIPSAGGGFGTAGGDDDLALVEVGVRCSLEQVSALLPEPVSCIRVMVLHQHKVVLRCCISTRFCGHLQCFGVVLRKLMWCKK